MPSYPYSSFQIEAVINAPKHTRDWEPLEFKEAERGSQGRIAKVVVEMDDGSYYPMQFIVRASDWQQVHSFKATFLLEGQKVRGVDHHAIEKVRGFGRQISPRGWHQDVIDPNLAAGHKAQHRRLALTGFSPLHLLDFTEKVAALWNIALPPSSTTLELPL